MNQYRFRNFIPSLTLLSLSAVVMSLLRPLLSNTNSYIYMNWNLILGIMPLVFAWLFFKKMGGSRLAVVWLLLWVFFLPNAPYMITDLIHIDDIGPSSIHWYDSLMLFGFAWVGILSWIHSTAMVYQRMKYKSFIPIISLFTAFGMYLGRYIRFNTWDIVAQLDDVALTVIDTILRPLHHDPFLLFTTVFWVFLMTTYVGYSYLHGIHQEKKES